MEAGKPKARQERKNNWIHPRHRVARLLLGPLVTTVTGLVTGAKGERFPEEGEEPWLILYNHQTTFDQFVIPMIFRKPVYYVATEDIFSIGWLAGVMRWLAAPIPIKKQSMDPNALRAIFQVAREGGSIAIAPEGNRTYSGKTEYMNPAIARLALRLRLPIALVRFEGGYGVQPRWSDGLRKGRMKAYVSRVIRPEEYASMTKEELYSVITEGLYVNEAVSDGRYISRKKAEYLERAVYVCPYCGLSAHHSSWDEIECLSCHRRIRYGEDKQLEGIGFDSPFSFVNDWYEYQKSFVNKLDVMKYRKEAMFHDQADMYEVLIYKRKILLRKGAPVSLYGDRITAGDETFPFEELTGAAVLGRNKLNIYYRKRIIQFKGGKRFNALKYVNIFYRYRNLTGGSENGEFLGL